jgi:hypothetical protein
VDHFCHPEDPLHMAPALHCMKTERLEENIIKGVIKTNGK